MRRRFKRTGLVLTLAVLTVTVLGASSYSASAEPSAPAAETLRTMGFGTPDEIARVRVEEAKKAIAPNDVDMDTAGCDEQKFLAAGASGWPPDIVYIGRERIGTYANRDSLTALTS